MQYWLHYVITCLITCNTLLALVELIFPFVVLGYPHVVRVFPLVILVCPLVVLVCPLVVLVCPLVVLNCPLVISVCPLVVLVVLSVSLFITDQEYLSVNILILNGIWLCRQNVMMLTSNSKYFADNNKSYCTTTSVF